MIKVIGGGNQVGLLLHDQVLLGGMSHELYHERGENYVEISREVGSGRRYVGSPQVGSPLVIEYAEAANGNS